MDNIFCRVLSAGISGIEVYPVNVEADICNGLPGFYMVGLLSSEVKEARERVRSAIKNSGVFLPAKRVTINLSPADKRKEGTVFDIPIAVSILCAVGAINKENINNVMTVGELSLDGSTKPVNGILNMIIMAKKLKVKKVIVPIGNIDEASLVKGVDIIGVSSLEEIINILNGTQNIIKNISKSLNAEFVSEREYSTFDFGSISGQESVKRAVVIAVSGMHNILLVGEPGSGKSIIAKSITDILPQMTKEEELEISGIYSTMGMLKNGKLLKQRPFRMVHHTISPSALAGGGMNPKPGEITLAHRGVLFMDELPEFKRETLEILRQPMEDKSIVISRKEGSFLFPSDFMVVGAMNPCPCGFYPDRSKCSCTKYDINRYLNKIRGALIDRIDICIETPRIKIADIQKKNKSESPMELRRIIEETREIQMRRYSGTNIRFNSGISLNNIDEYCGLGSREKETAGKIYNKLNLSARGYHKLLKVSRTIADMEKSENIKEEHILEAAGYRNFII